jgi:hypothetical protein
LKGKAMNRNYLWLIVVVLLVGLVFTTMLATAQEAKQTLKWEYNAVGLPAWFGPTSNNETIEAKLNELGQTGWELVVLEERSCILKRPAN